MDSRPWRVFGKALLAVPLIVPVICGVANAHELGVKSFRLALTYEHGEGVDRDYAKALRLYCEAADHRYPPAFLNLGWMFANGRGVTRNDGVAVAWWRKAAASGIPQAANLLELMPHVSPISLEGCSGRQFHGSVPSTSKVRALVRYYAPASGLDSNLVLALIAVESDFDARSVSRKSAKGLMQLMPETAARFGVKQPFDPAQNIRGGTAYLQWLLQRYHGALGLALAGYNAGEKNVDRYGGVPPFKETKTFLERIDLLYPFLGRFKMSSPP